MLHSHNLTATAILFLGGLTVATGGCQDGSGLGANEGRIRFVMSSDGANTLGAADATTSALPTLQSGSDLSTPPALHGDGSEENHTGWFQSANVTFSSILARNQDGVLVDVAMDLPTTVDVMIMDGGKQITLPDGELPAATYDQLVVVMTRVEGVTWDGTAISITPPGGGWTSVAPICPFTVEEGATTVVGLSFKVRSAFSWRNQRYHFQPSFSCDGGDSSGSSS